MANSVCSPRSSPVWRSAELSSPSAEDPEIPIDSTDQVFVRLLRVFCANAPATQLTGPHPSRCYTPNGPLHAGPMPPPPDAIVTFGPFVLDRTRKALVREGEPVRIGGRAMDLLDALVEQPGEVLSRDTLVARVWPRAVVEETSLRVHVLALRKALGDGYIANVPGRAGMRGATGATKL